MKLAIIASMALSLPITAYAFQSATTPAECSPQLKDCNKPVKWLADKKECSCFACEYGKPTQHTGCTSDKETKAELLKLDVTGSDPGLLAEHRLDELNNSIANLDNYQSVAETSVKFGFNKDSLTSKAKEELDQLAGSIASTKGYVIVLEGNTDSVGPAEYNYDLSQRRANSVIQYLASKYNVPAHKIYVIGLGKDKPAESNKTAAGRADNREVLVQVMADTSSDNKN
jgi:outer membrane protein OmpA-like peptidoglycan-associated protein